MSNDRTTKLLLATIAGLLGIIALRGGGPSTSVAVAAPDGPAAVGRLQVSGTPTGFVAFDPDTGEVWRAVTEKAFGMGVVGTIRKDASGKWELVPRATGAAQPAAAPGSPGPAAEATRLTTAQANLTSLLAALNVFKVDTGRYPKTEEGLHALVVQPTGVENWKGPYVKPSLPMDPWGNPYVYYFPGRADAAQVELMSFGPDKKEGGGDDLIAGAPVPPPSAK